MPAKRNLTIQLDEEIIREARGIAAERATSVSSLVAEQLRELVERHRDYTESRRRRVPAASLQRISSTARLLRASESRIPSCRSDRTFVE